MFRSFLLILLFVKLPLGIYAQTLHVVFVADLQDAQFGMMSIRDQEAMTKVVETIQWGIGYKLQTTYLSPNNKNFTAEVVKKTINTLKTQPNDLIFVYYSGLGYYPSENKEATIASRNWFSNIFSRSAASVSSKAKPFRASDFPSFQLNGYEKNPLSLDDIADLITAKGVRFGMVMADCRNSFPAPLTTVVASSIITEDIRKLVIRKLFLEPCGVMKIASARQGESVYTNVFRNSSAFTTAFSSTFYEVLLMTTFKTLKDVSLNKLLNDAQKMMESGPVHQGGLGGYVTPEKMPHALWKMNDCNTSLKKIVTPLPSYDQVPTIKDLQKEFRLLIGIQNAADRTKQIEKLSTYFDKNASVKVTRSAQNDTLNRQATIPISEYLQGMEKPNPKLVEIRLHPVYIKRTDDFRLIKEIITEETWTEW